MTTAARAEFERHAASIAPPTYRQHPIRPVGRPPNKTKHKPMGLSRKVKAAIDIMQYDGATRPEAAQRVGLADNSLRQAFNNPQVMRYWKDCLDVLRTSEQPRSIRKIASLRDNAAAEGVQLKAAIYLDGGDRQSPGVQVNVGINLTPGYQVDVGSMADMQLLKLSGSTRNALELSHSVGTQGEETHE